MSSPTPPLALPAIGERVYPDQELGLIPSDPGHGISNREHHRLVVIDEKTRDIGYTKSIRSGDHSPGLEGPQRWDFLPGQIAVYWGVSSSTIRLEGEYLPYPPLDGSAVSSVDDPINPLPLAAKWQNILSRFAHDVMSFNPQSNHLRSPDTHITGHLPPTDAAAALKNKVTYQLARAVVGVAYYRIGEWAKLDAERLALYPATVPDAENWKIWQEGTIPVAENEIQHPNMGDMMAMICGDAVKEIAGMCVGAWVYTLNDRIDASTYDSILNSTGEIRLPNPVWDLWRPWKYLHRVTGTRSQRLDRWAEIMGWFREAHDHYLASVAPAVEHAT